MFETVFRMALGSSAGSDRRWQSLPVSLAFHSLAIGAFALLSVRTITQSPEPPVPIVFLQGSAPPLPLGENLPATPPSDSQERPVSAILVQPEEILPSAEISERSRDTPVPPGDEEPGAGATPGDPKGRSEGSRTGIAGSDGRDGPRAGDSEHPFVPGGDVTEPRLVYRVEPAYPETARKVHIEGVAILQAIISGSGNVEDIQVVKSINPLLDAEAVRAVKQWRYRPATLNGRPVRVYLTVTVEFRLR